MTSSWEHAVLHHEAQLLILRNLEPDVRVCCPVECGCNGTRTVAEAIAHHRCELEILAK